MKQGNPARTAAELARIAHALNEVGFGSLLGVDAHIQKTRDKALSDDERLASVVAAWLQMVDTARAMMTGEMVKMRTLLSSLDAADPVATATRGLLEAFTVQERGLGLLRAFLDGGDRSLLDEAKTLVQRGMADAQEAARSVRKR